MFQILSGCRSDVMRCQWRVLGTSTQLVSMLYSRHFIFVSMEYSRRCGNLPAARVGIAAQHYLRMLQNTLYECAFASTTSRSRSTTQLDIPRAMNLEHPGVPLIHQRAPAFRLCAAGSVTANAQHEKPRPPTYSNLDRCAREKQKHKKKRLNFVCHTTV